MTLLLCGIPAKTLPPCDLPWGHDGAQHANRGDGFYSREHAEEHIQRQRVVAAARAAAVPLIVLLAVKANPDAFAEIAEVLAGGGIKHGGGLGPDDVQTPEDHVAAALRHLHQVRDGAIDIDRDTGRPTLAHVAGRAVLALTRARDLAGAGKGRTDG